MKTRFFSPDERVERDSLMREAGIDPYSQKAYPSWKIKENLRISLEDAAQAGRRWAQYELEDALQYGVGKIWSTWQKEQNPITAQVNGKEVRVAGSQGLRQRNKDGKTTYQQLTFDQMLWPDVFQFRDNETTRRGGADININIANKLIELQALAPDSAGPAEAAASIGTTVEAWLMTNNQQQTSL